MKMDHQTTAAAAAPSKSSPMPEAVSLDMAELTGAVKGPYATNLGRRSRTLVTFGV